MKTVMNFFFDEYVYNWILGLNKLQKTELITSIIVCIAAFCLFITEYFVLSAMILGIIYIAVKDIPWDVLWKMQDKYNKDNYNI